MTSYIPRYTTMLGKNAFFFILCKKGERERVSILEELEQQFPFLEEKNDYLFMKKKLLLTHNRSTLFLAFL